MRLKYSYITPLLATVFLLMGCSKWLDINPKSRLPERILFENEQGFKDALIGVYIQLGARDLYGREMTMGLMDVLAMNYDVQSNTNPYYPAAIYDYKDVGTRHKIDRFWTASYQAISNINNMLEVIDDKKSLFTGNNYQMIKGEALALRAFLHFDLLRIFGPVPVNGLSKTGIPYVTTFDMEIKSFISTQAVIDHCLSDLDAASVLLSVDKTVNYGMEDIFHAYTRNRMNYWAATGLMARIALYEGNKTMALEKATEVIDSGLFPFVKSSEISTSDALDRIFSMEHLFCVYVSNLTDINSGLFKSSAADTLLTATDAQINERFEIGTGGSTDYRYLFLWLTEGSSALKYPAKYWQDNVVNNSRNRIPLIRFSEMFYIAAESASTAVDKIALLDTVRQHRGQQRLSTELNPAEIENEIFKEYKKEFYQEGQLFFYYKRLNKPKIDGYVNEVGASIYVLPIPDDENEFNPSAHENI